MAGTLQVENLIGPTTGANTNTVSIPSGQTLHAPGHVIQVVHETGANAEVTGSSNTWFNGPLSVSITPKFTTSKILFTWSQPFRLEGSGSITRGGISVVRDGTSIWNTLGLVEMFQVRGTSGAQELSNVGCGNVLDAPNTTNQITYYVQGLWYPDSGTTNMRMWRGSRGATATALEIAQ